VNALYPSRPNPFNPRTVIRYSLAAEGPARIDLFDATGRRVRTLIEGRQTAGPHEIVWNGEDGSGHPLGSGVYWVELSAGSYRSSKKLVLLK
jgi:flagellar hook assembly protein FlgD